MKIKPNPIDQIGPSISGLRALFNGRVIAHDDPRYEQAHTVFYGGRGAGAACWKKFNSLIALPWIMWLALALPILFVHNGVSDTDWEFGSGGWPFLYYTFFLLYSFVIVSNERLQANIKRIRWTSLIGGLLMAAANVFLVSNVENYAIRPWENRFGDSIFHFACSLRKHKGKRSLELPFY